MNSERLRKPRIEIIAAASVLPAPQPVLQPPLNGMGGDGCPVYTCADSVGAGIIAPAELRRIGRSQKMGLTAVRSALARRPNSAVDPNAAICVGTALGTLAETAAFLENMVERDECEPRPARFINSVHNAIASRIGISLGCRGENHTFAHQAISFELALWHAMHLLRTGRAREAIVCGADEWSPYVNAVGRARGWWRTNAQPLTPLRGDAQSGTLPGEGAGALILRKTEEASTGALLLNALCMESLTIPHSGTKREVQFIRHALARANMDLSEVEMLLVGANGDARNDAAHAAVSTALSAEAGREVMCGTFKQLCGEFCTASAVGLVTAVEILRGQKPAGEIITSHPPMPGPPRSILLYNWHETGCHSACLVTV